jgi:hypothetical protein
MVVGPASRFTMDSLESEPEPDSWQKGTGGPQHEVKSMGVPCLARPHPTLSISKTFRPGVVLNR